MVRRYASYGISLLVVLCGVWLLTMVAVGVHKWVDRPQVLALVGPQDAPVPSPLQASLSMQYTPIPVTTSNHVEVHCQYGLGTGYQRGVALTDLTCWQYLK